MVLVASSSQEATISTIIGPEFLSFREEGRQQALQ